MKSTEFKSSMNIDVFAEFVAINRDYHEQEPFVKHEELDAVFEQGLSFFKQVMISAELLRDDIEQTDGLINMLLSMDQRLFDLALKIKHVQTVKQAIAQRDQANVSLVGTLEYFKHRSLRS